jgi:hypothetical protein
MSSHDEDYLDEDKPFRHMVKKQNYCVISMLTPNAFPESKREEYRDQKILGLKIRGVFETYDDAKDHASKIQKLDKFHNVFVGEVGKWLPFDVDISNMQTDEDPVYREKSLNQYMKSYKDALKEEEVQEKERKEEQLKGAKIVTGKTDAPESLGLGTINNDDNDKPLEIKEDVDIESTELDILDNEIQKTTDAKNKLVNDLEESSNYMKSLEDKISTINDIYSKLQK